MGYLATEIIALLAGAAVLGFIVGWATFGLGKKKVIAPQAGLSTTNPKLEADVKVAVEARKKAEARIIELEAKESNFGERLGERDAKVAELSHQLDELAKLRVEAASEKNQAEQKDQRIVALEAQLRQRDADIAQVAAQSGSNAMALDLQQQVVDRERQIAKLKTEVEALSAQVSPDGPKVADLQAEIAELRATLVATAGAAPTTASEKDAIIGRLNEEVTGLRAAYEAAEQALEEQDAAIDKLTRELVSHQQRVSQLEGRDAQRPSSGVMPRPQTNPSSAPTSAVAGAPKPTAALGTQVFKTSPVPPDVRMEPPPRVEPPKIEPARVEPTKIEQLEANESTMAVSLEDLVAAVDARPEPAKAMTPPPMAIEVSESTVAIALSDIVARIDTKPPGPPPMAEVIEASESTVAISLSDIVARIDTRVDMPAVMPAAPAEVIEANESTVAISVADLVGRIDGGQPASESLDGTAGHAGDGTDLKRIKGIGPATEKRLNGAGITRWSQVADLNDNDLPAIADLLKVSVDKIKPWVEQAKALRS